MQRLDYLGRGAELHIRHPHTHEFLILIREFFIRIGVEDIFPEAVGIQGVGVAAVDYLVEII